MLRNGRWAAALLLAWAVPITFVRAFQLASGPPSLRAHGERAFFSWSWRSGEIRRQLSAAGARLAAGARVWVVSRDPAADPDWLRVMALYELPRQVVLGAGPLPARQISGAAVVMVGAGGRETPAGLPGRSGRSMDLLATVLGAALVLLVGHAAAGTQAARPVSDLPAEGGVGLAIACVFVFLLGLLGAPITPATIIGSEIVLAAILLRLRMASIVPARGSSADRDPLAIACEVSAAIAFLVACWKWARVPLWSWDHYAIWGVKSLRMIADGRLDLSFLKHSEFESSVPAYPIGVPLAWRVLRPGIPGTASFKVCHVLFAGGLLASVREAARRLTRSRALAGSLAAAVAVSPLFWDTEALGLAEMPLAFLALSSLALFLRASDDPKTSPWPAGLALAFLPWIKEEGILLAVLLGAVAVVSFPRGRVIGDRRRWTAAILLPVVVGIATAVLVRKLLLAPGVSFFDGNWSDRVAARLQEPRPILALLGRELAARDWLGLWLLVAAGLVAAVAMRRRTCALLIGVVILQLAAYTAVYFATYLDPLAHIRSSFFRVAAGMAPLALLGAGCAFARWSRQEAGSASRAEATAAPSGP